MSTTRRMNTKLVLLGEERVGKSSLIRRFVLNEYQDAYLHTVGTRVSKVELTVPFGADIEVEMAMSIFDIVGERGFRDLVREAYYHGAQALMGVCDLTQKESLAALDDWIPSALEITGTVPVYLVVNKKDMEDQRAIPDEEVRRVAGSLGAPFVYTSAKTGESVEDAFNALAIEIVERAHRHEAARAAGQGLRERILALLDKRGPIGLKKNQFFEILRGVQFNDLQVELDRLEGEGLLTILWYGASDFSATITPRGTKILKQASDWEGV